MAAGAAGADRGRVLLAQRQAARLRQLPGEARSRPSATTNRACCPAAPAPLPWTVRAKVNQRLPSSNATSSATIRPALLERGMQSPQRARRLALEHDRAAGAGEPFGDLPGAVDPQHEERQSARADPLQSGQAVRELLEADSEAALEDGTS